MSKNKEMLKEEIICKAVNGEIKLYEIDEYFGPKESVVVRRNTIARLTDTDLSHIGESSIDENDAVKRNIENMIGTVQIPLGIAGPLTINGEYVRGDLYLPLATTEGALVASTNRGCSVITASGGANVRIFSDGMTRAPVFSARSIKHAKDFIKWVNNNFNNIKARAEETTKFGELLDISPYVVGNNIYLRFKFDTKDAMGMNMATIATDAVSDLITEQFDVKLVSLSGNVCTDKKPSAINNILGRGKTVAADVVIPKNVVESKLKTDPDAMVEVNYKKNLLGSARAGSTGYNAQVANIVAAMYIGCGQDAAHVVEASSAITTMEHNGDGNLYCSITISAVQVGTVGGGTGLATQKECLKILGVEGPGNPPGTNANKLAEIITAAALAGEISLIGAQAAGHLARAHKQLGRG